VQPSATTSGPFILILNKENFEIKQKKLRISRWQKIVLAFGIGQSSLLQEEYEKEISQSQLEQANIKC